jgi:diaminopimelate decarboxylase
MFNIESVEELEQINRTALRLKTRARIAFRINPNVDPHTHRHISTGQKKAKFGIPYDEVIATYIYASKLKGVTVAGIHSHIGSQITEVGPFKLAAQRVHSVVNKLASAGILLSFVDLGGGLGIQYGTEHAATPAELSHAVLPVFKDFKGTFIFEPGRYIVGNTAVLLVKVLYRKAAGGKNYIIIDGGMNDLIRPALYEAYHDIVPVLKTSREKVKADVVGPICESSDFLGKDRMLSKPAQGEYLAVKCAGAYGYAMSSQYNSHVRAAEVMVEGKHCRLIRQRETFQDLVVKELLF